jgi:tRNA(fMet)-specific endonuclease VapC
MYLIDTNVFMHLANGSHGAERIERRIIEVTAEKCFINPVIASELREKIETGAGRVRKHALQFMADILATVQCIEVDCASGQESGLIRAEQSKKGKSIATPDALIAGHARHTGMILVTDNTRHFSGIARLKLENWRV